MGHHHDRNHPENKSSSTVSQTALLLTKCPLIEISDWLCCAANWLKNIQPFEKAQLGSGSGPAALRLGSLRGEAPALG